MERLFFARAFSTSFRAFSEDAILPEYGKNGH